MISTRGGHDKDLGSTAQDFKITEAGKCGRQVQLEKVVGLMEYLCLFCTILPHRMQLSKTSTIFVVICRF